MSRPQRLDPAIVAANRRESNAASWEERACREEFAEMKAAMLSQKNHYAPCFRVHLKDSYPNEKAHPTWYTGAFADWLGPGPIIKVDAHSPGNWTVELTLPPPSQLPHNATDHVRALTEEVADAWRQHMLATVDARMAQCACSSITMQIECVSWRLSWATSWIDHVLRPFLEPHYVVEAEKNVILRAGLWIDVTLAGT